MTRTVITLPAKWPFPAERFWSYRFTNFERISSRLSRLTRAELELVASAIGELIAGRQ
jgi:hypothetical protein